MLLEIVPTLQMGGTISFLRVSVADILLLLLSIPLFLHWHFVLYFMQKNAKITAVGNMEHFWGVINL